MQKNGSPLEMDCHSIFFKIPKNCKFFLNAAARMLCLCNQLANEGKEVILDFSDCPDTFSYFDRVGYIDELNADIKTLPKRSAKSRAKVYRNNSDAVLEIERVDLSSKANILCGNLIEKFLKHAGEEYSNLATVVLGEPIDNIREHSETRLNGFAGFQKYTGRAQAVISDNGLGIAATLRPALEEYYPKLHKKYARQGIEEDIELVKEALQQGRISRFGPERGSGFESTKDKAMEFNANVCVRQEKFLLSFKYKDGKLDEVKVLRDLVKISGTHISFDFMC